MDIQTFTTILIYILVGLLFLIFISYQISKKGMKQMAIDMIINAEKKFEKGKNDEKMKFVIAKVEELLATTFVGKFLLFFITEEMIEKFIQNIFDTLKKALDYKEE